MNNAPSRDGTPAVLYLMESTGLNRYWQAALPIVKNHGFAPYFVNVLVRDEFQDWADSVGIPNTQLGCRSSTDYLGAVIRMKNIIADTRPALVHCSEEIGSAIGGLAARLAHVPALYHRHHCENTGKRALFAWVASRTCQLAMAVSDAAAGFVIRENGLPADRVRVVRNGIAELRDVAAKEIAAVRSSLGIRADAAVITMVARLRAVKGHTTLFRSLPSIAGRIAKPVHVLVVGTGPEEARLRVEAAAIPGATIHFIGHVDDISLWYRAGDVAVMPSEVEPFGLVAVEAMSAGVPLVASAVQGLQEVVEDGRSGLLVPPASPAALADAIVRVLANAELRQQLIAGGRERFLHHFTTDAMVRGWTDCYRTVLAGTRFATATAP